MKTKYILLVLALVALAQAFLPIKMIYDSKVVQTEGTVYKFRTQPIDPADPFRGKYVALKFEAEEWVTEDTAWVAHEQVFAYIKEDSAGFAEIKQLSREPLADGGDYVMAEVAYFYNNDKTVRIKFPFDRYYMEESKAPEAEKAYAEYSRSDNAKPAYALVAVKDGSAVLKDVIVDSLPIREYVIKHREAKQ